jgi:hypothetical protein
MNTAEKIEAPAVETPAATKPAKAKVAKLSFSKDYSFEIQTVESALEKMRGDMGRYRTLAVKHGLQKTVRDMAGEAIPIVTPEMGAKLKQAGLITAREAEDIRHFSAAIKALEGIASYDARKALEAAKRK